MTTLGELRTYVRVQTETTASELPDATIDRFLREGFNRTIAAETTWPFYEENWVVTQTAGNAYATLPTDVGIILALKDPSNQNFRLNMLSYEEAEDQYFRGEVSGTASEFSIWKSIIYFWPSVTFDTDREYQLRGYRTPADWLTGATTSTEPDADSRLHLPLAHYAIALAYAQQEDLELEQQYMRRWQSDVEMARKAIMDPRHQRPVIMGPQRISRIGAGKYRPSFTITTP